MILNIHKIGGYRHYKEKDTQADGYPEQNLFDPSSGSEDTSCVCPGQPS